VAARVVANANGDANAVRRVLFPLRSKLLLASALVQIVMLALLIYNGLSVMDAKLAERTRVQLDEQKNVLSAALAGPLLQGDRVKAQEILDRARRNQAIQLALFDRAGKLVASSGWEAR